MIGKLRGRIDSIEEDHVIIDVAGVGYIAFCSARTLLALPPVGESAEIIIETHVREDHIHLYGFGDVQERDWFRQLTTVQGVGVKMALKILDILSPQQLTATIASQDYKPLTAASGVGKKLAERIITELKGKVEKISVGHGAGGGNIKLVSGGSAALSPAAKGTLISEDAVSALVNLGYNRSDAYGAVNLAMQKYKDGGDAKLEELITHGLKELVR